MPALHLTTDLIARVERFGADFHTARMGAAAALPGNPFGIQIRRFGGAVAVKAGSPLLRGKNRAFGLGPDNASVIDDLLHFYRCDDLPVSLSIPYGKMTPELFRQLTNVGMWSAGTGASPVVSAGNGTDTGKSPLSEIVVRISPPEERERYLNLFQRAFTDRAERTPEYRLFQWAEDSLPDGARYIAEIGGEPVGMASFPVVGGVGYCGTAGVLPEYRGRGVQIALIRRRIADAPTLGCDLVIGGGSPGTTTYRNFERAGMRAVPTGMSWGMIPVP